MNTRTSYALAAIIFGAVVFGPAAPAVETADYAYDEAGRLIGVSYGDGTTINYFYDRAGNLLRRTVSTFVDSVGNGIDDNWEMEHFGTIGVDPGAPSASPGMTVLMEFLSGTDPNDPDDFLRVTEFQGSVEVGFVIEWSAVPGKLYRVQYTNTLAPHDWFDLPGDVLAEGATASKTDFAAPEHDRRFYRVVVLR